MKNLKKFEELNKSDNFEESEEELKVGDIVVLQYFNYSMSPSHSYGFYNDCGFYNDAICTIDDYDDLIVGTDQFGSFKISAASYFIRSKTNNHTWVKRFQIRKATPEEIRINKYNL